MKRLNIYLCGVGGQGINLLSQVLAQAAVRAGHDLIGCDTHGLAQRGGTVVSNLRLGQPVFGPLIPSGAADLVIALERLEAYRAAEEMLCSKDGQLIYYDTQYQPIHVRQGKAAYPTIQDVERLVIEKAGQVTRVYDSALPDPRMQNVALLGQVAKLNPLPGWDRENIQAALKNTLAARILDDNIKVFERSAA